MIEQSLGDRWIDYLFSGGQVPKLELPKIKNTVLTDMKQIRVTDQSSDSVLLAIEVDDLCNHAGNNEYITVEDDHHFENNILGMNLGTTINEYEVCGKCGAERLTSEDLWESRR